MGKFLVLTGGIVAGGGFVTGVAGLTILGMTDSESDIIRKKMEIDGEKLKIQKQIVLENDKIKKVEEEISEVQEAIKKLKKDRDTKQKEIKGFSDHLKEKFEKLKQDINSEKCQELNISDFLKKDNVNSIKNDDWYKQATEQFKGTIKFGKQCKEEI